MNAIESLSEKTFLMTRSLKVPVIDDIIVPLEAPGLGIDVMLAVPIIPGVDKNLTANRMQLIRVLVFRTV